MASFRPSLFAFVVLPALLAVPSRAVADLSTDSPFMPVSSAGAATPSSVAGLEFRGIVEIDQVDYFNIVDLGTKKGAWVKLNDKSGPFVVTSHEVTPNGDLISVEQAGRVVQLAMAKPKIGNAPVASAPPPNQQGPIFPVVLNPTAADEARRMEAFAAEVRRRRMLRQQEAAKQEQQERPPGAQGVPPPQQQAP